MISRQQERRMKSKLAEAHNKKLVELLHGFCSFLKRKPQPSTEEVRTEFRKSEMAWKLYCLQNSLGIKASLMFNARVSYEWERKKHAMKR